MSVHRPRDAKGDFKSPFFHYDFQLAGVRFHGSTGETEKRKALAHERLKRDEAEAQHRHGQRTDRTSIDFAFDRFWDEKGQHEGKPSTTFYRLERLADGLKTLLTSRGRPHSLAAVDDDIIAAYIARRRGQTSRHNRLMSPSSVNREIQLLRRVMLRAVKVWKLPVVLPAWADLLLPEANERVVDMSADIEARLLAEMRDDFRPAARFLILSGLRLGNVLPLHPSCIDFENDILTVMLKSKRPGGRVHVLPITTPMKVILANEMAHGHNDAVFTFIAQRTLPKKGYVRGLRYPLDDVWLYREFKRAAATIGHPALRLHDLRHVAGTRILRATKNLRAAQHQLGHTRIDTTTRYAHHLIDDLRAGMEAAHSPGENPGTADSAEVKHLTRKNNPA